MACQGSVRTERGGGFAGRAIRGKIELIELEAMYKERFKNVREKVPVYSLIRPD
jgi:hypothetical protein